MVERIKNEPELRKNFESVRGKPYVDKLLADHDRHVKEAEQLKKNASRKICRCDRGHIDRCAGPRNRDSRYRWQGGQAVCFKGKVVVLDIWATWCDPCKAMIPHEREMVERLKDKPFALVSISADEKKETFKEFLSKEKMPWTHWWNGSQGGVIDDWNIQYFPTIYVIDSEGVIRHKDLRDEKLEAAVNELLKEMDKKKAG